MKGFLPEWIKMCVLKLPACVQEYLLTYLCAAQKVSLLNGLACVSWGYQLLCKRSCTVCKQKNSSLYEPACDFSDEKHWRFSSRTGCNCGASFRHAESYVSWCLCSSWRRGCTDHMSKVCLKGSHPSKNTGILWNTFIKWLPLPPVLLLWNPYSDIATDFGAITISE